MKDRTPVLHRKGIYLLPTLITTTNIGLGFYSILFSISSDGYYSRAAWCIIVAIIFDIFDGKIARWTGTESVFGVQMDSFADAISFGLAPALLVYQLHLYALKDWGVIVSLCYFLAAIFRLARFNICALGAEEKGPDHFFSGLPVPGAAGVISSFVIVYSMIENEVTRKTIPIVMKKVPFFFNYLPLLMILLTYLMVSNLRYAKFKSLKLTGGKSKRTMLTILCGIFLVWKYPENMLLILFVLYLLSGIIDFLVRTFFLTRKRREQENSCGV